LYRVHSAGRIFENDGKDKDFMDSSYSAAFFIKIFLSSKKLSTKMRSKGVEDELKTTRKACYCAGHQRSIVNIVKAKACC
jgi:hypothetical protein